MDVRQVAVMRPTPVVSSILDHSSIPLRHAESDASRINEKNRQDA